MISLRYPVIFDNDCLASFLWVRRTDILHSLYGSNIIIPGIVINEFSYMRRARNKFVYDDLQDLIAAGQARVETLPITGPLANQFTGLENGSIIGKPLGKGESSAIVLTDHLRGTLASNNLRDIAKIMGSPIFVPTISFIRRTHPALLLSKRVNTFGGR